jgi:enamine deaminase RidA (YjgF/YER057c/UK114 family)
MRPLVLSLVLAAAPAFAAPPRPIVPEGLEWQVEDYAYSPAVRAGDFIFVSGVVAGIGKDAAPTPERMEEAFERAFERLGVVLAAAGAGFGDVVEMTSYHVDLPAQADAILKVRRRHMHEPYSAWTAIDVDRLWPDDGIAEIRLTVFKPEAAR